MRFDHIAIAAETLEEGVAWAEDRLGVAMVAGGKHERFGTHNQLLGLADGLYLEVIAVDPDATCKGPRWFGLDDFRGPPRLVNWICEPDNFEDFLRYGMRSVPMKRGDLRWDMGAPEDGRLPMGGGFPTVLRWHTDQPPGRALPASGCSLTSLTINHPQAVELAAELDGHLQDQRIQFKDAAEISLQAVIQTPTAAVVL